MVFCCPNMKLACPFGVEVPNQFCNGRSQEPAHKFLNMVKTVVLANIFHYVYLYYFSNMHYVRVLGKLPMQLGYFCLYHLCLLTGQMFSIHVKKIRVLFIYLLE